MKRIAIGVVLAFGLAAHAGAQLTGGYSTRAIQHASCGTQACNAMSPTWCQTGTTWYACDLVNLVYVAVASGGGGPAFGTIGTAVADTGGDTLAVNDSATIDFTTADNPESVTAAVVANSIGPTQIDEAAGYAFSALGNTTLAPGSKLTRSGVKFKEVCASGCEFTTICGAICSSATSDCVAGSAIQAIKDAADFSPTNPYETLVRPGTYDECVAFNDVTDVTLRIGAGARIVPTVADFDDVAGGVIRIANNTTAKVERITIVSDGYVRNDAFSSPEGALTVGVEACSGAAPWNDILVVGGTWIGHHDSIHVCGSNVDSDTATDVPRITIRDLNAISGADTIVKKVSSAMTVRNVQGFSMTNYCETATADVTDLESGTVDATGASTTTFTLDGDANTTEHAYVGRHGRLTGGTCAAGIDFWVRDYTAAKLVTTTGSLGLTPDATCSYAIDAVVNASEAPCNEIDWTAIRGTVATTPHGYWKNTGLHFGYIVTGSNPAPDLDLTAVYDTTFKVEVNDFGPADGSSACTPTAQQHISGILAYVSGAAHHFQRAIFENVHIDVTNSTVMRSSTAQSDNLCPYPLTGLSIPSTVFEDEVVFTGDITVRNTADPGAEDYGVVLLSASTVRLPQAQIVVDNSVGGYAGSTAHLVQTAGTLSVGQVTSDGEVTSSGTIAYEHQRGTVRRTASALTSRGETRVPASGDGFYWYDSAQREGAAIAGQIGGTSTSPDVRGLRETGGPTLLSMGAVVDGECFARSGTTIDGVACGGGSSEFSDEGTVLRPGDATDDYVRVSGATNGPAVGSADDASVCLAPSGGASPACEIKISRSSDVVTTDRASATEVIYDYTNSGAGASKVRADSLESAGTTAGCLTQTEDSPGTNTAAWCVQSSRTTNIIVNPPDEAGTHVAVTETATQTLTNKTAAGGDSGAGTTRPSGSNILGVRTHDTDCTSLTDGKQGEVCVDEDDGASWTCIPTAGDCTGAEWKRLDNSGGTPDIDAVTGQANWGTAATKETADLVFNGVEADFEAGAAEGFPRLAQNSSTPSAECDVAGEEGRLYWDTDGFPVGCNGTGGWVDVPTTLSVHTLNSKTVGGGDAGTGTTRAGSANILQTRTVDGDAGNECNTLTDGKHGEQCVEEDDGAIWVCIPSAGDCDTAGEWKRRDDTGAGGGDPVLIGGVAVGDASGVDLIGGAGIDIVFDSGVSPDTATFALNMTELVGTTTFGGGAGQTWVWNAGVTDPQVVIGSDSMAWTAGTFTLNGSQVLTAATGQPLDTDLSDIAGLTPAQGAIILGTATPTWGRLTIGATGSVLFSNGTTAAWDATPALACDDCTANTEAADNSTTQVATTAFVQQEHADSAGSCTDQVVTAVNADAPPTCANVSSAMIGADVVTAADVAASLDTRKCGHLIIPDVAVTDEFVIRLPPFAGTMTRIDCEAFSGTSFTINICDGEDIGDDTCTTSIPGSTMVCDTTGANDTTLTNPGFAARDKVSLVVTAVTGTVIGDVYITCTVD